MVRTMAGGQRKAVVSKAPRKTAVSSSSSSGSSSSSSSSSVFSPSRAGKPKSRSSAVGLNPATQWDTPKWQKGIASFFKKASEPEAAPAQDTMNTSNNDEDSNDTVDLNAQPVAPTIESIFDEPGASRSGTSSGSSDDGERPGPSSRM